MLAGIINEETTNNSYYIYLVKKDNYSELSIVHINDNVTESLSKDDAVNLIKKILSSKLTFKEKENDYDIYLDEANNKRYFKNGRENYFKFLENNGVDAICYIERINKKDSPRWHKVIVDRLVFSILISAFALTPFAGNIRYVEAPKYFISSVVELSSEEMTNLIKTSNNIEEKWANYLANDNYFDFVAKYSNNSNKRKYLLREKLHNLRIRHYQVEEFPDTLGYYDIQMINTVNILDTQQKDENRYKDILTHEFIHLTQSQNKYCYIIEASAEMLEYEFFNQPVNDYYELIKREKVLMEIIGPQPVIECNFSGDNKSFEDAIKNYLNEQDADKLLGYLSTADIHEPEKQVIINKEIDSLLAKMYKNKTGKDIKDDLMIREIYSSSTNNRIYFNTTKKEYYEGFRVVDEAVEKEPLDINDVINSDEVISYSYVEKKVVTKNNKTTTYSLPMIKKDFSTIPDAQNKKIEVRFKDGTYGIITFDREKNQWNKVQHIEYKKRYEPPIPEKFPNQNLNNSIKNEELSNMMKETQIDPITQKSM